MNKSVRKIVRETALFLVLLFFISLIPTQSPRADQFTLMLFIGVLAVVFSILLYARGDYFSSVIFSLNVLTVLVVAILLSSLQLLTYHPYHSDIFIAGVPIFIVLLLTFTVGEKYEAPKWWWWYNMIVVGVATYIFLS